MMALGEGWRVVGLDLGRVVGSCSQQIHDQLCAKSRFRRIETDVDRKSSNSVRSGETMDTLAWLQVNFDADEVRTLIAEYLDIDAKRVTDEMHLSDDLGLDWLDKLELMILIEDKFADVEFSDAAAQEIEVVGDLIRQIEMSNKTPSVKNHQNFASTFFRSAA
jgi:acyl carrier protein